MIRDIRVYVGFFESRKTYKLKKALGAEAVLCLLQLWARAANARQDGILSGWDEEDIAFESGWSNTSDDSLTFVKTLVKVGYVDEKNVDGDYVLHNWDEWQEWTITENERSDKSRFSRLAGTNKKLYDKLIREGYNSISKKEYRLLTSSKKVNNSSQRPLTKVTTTVNESSDPHNTEHITHNASTTNTKEQPGKAEAEDTNKEKAVKNRSNKNLDLVKESKLDESFTRFWDNWKEYKRQKDRGQTFALWQEITKEYPKDAIIYAQECYLAEEEKKRTELKYIKTSKLWLQDARYADYIDDWEPGATVPSHESGFEYRPDPKDLFDIEPEEEDELPDEPDF